MNLVGLWKIRTAQQFDPKTLKLVDKNVEDILADESLDDDEKQMLYAKFLFTEDGWMKTLLPIPENAPKEEIEEAVASGEVEMYDDKTMVIEKKAWKEEDGKFKYDSGTKGEVLGEAIDPWMEITETDSGIKLFTYVLEKVE
ncbi:MAG: hypothetical protein IKO27_01635 [Ruminococcus sp.]|nr:hypothetical protein [Ruminococcus sp.]